MGVGCGITWLLQSGRNTDRLLYQRISDAKCYKGALTYVKEYEEVNMKSEMRKRHHVR